MCHKATCRSQRKGAAQSPLQEPKPQLHLVRISEYPVELSKLLMHLFVCELFYDSACSANPVFPPSLAPLFPLVLASWHKLASSSFSPCQAGWPSGARRQANFNNPDHQVPSEPLQ